MQTNSAAKEDIASLMYEIGRNGKKACRLLFLASAEQKKTALFSAAIAIRERTEEILAANKIDMEKARFRNVPASILDRLELNIARIESMANGVDAIADLPDPVGKVTEGWDRPNGLKIQRVSVPLGVIGIIYEARPNVTADAGALCIKSGNATILRSGSDSFESSRVIVECLHAGLSKSGLPVEAVQLIPTRDREAVGEMLKMTEWIDVIVPRGGKSLTERVLRESRIPTIQHLDGNCHTYIHFSADPGMAREVVLNAKMRRTGICGATESLLIDEGVAESILPGIIDDLISAGCELRGDWRAKGVDARLRAATEEDWSTEYLDAVLSIKTVRGVEEAVEHINRYGSHHTEAIIAADPAAVEEFLNGVDSAIVMHNASTQFADGGEFGMGAEIGISTGRLHARGPVGAEQLTTYKYVVRGNGQVRP